MQIQFKKANSAIKIAVKRSKVLQVCFFLVVKIFKAVTRWILNSSRALAAHARP